MFAPDAFAIQQWQMQSAPPAICWQQDEYRSGWKRVYKFLADWIIDPKDVTNEDGESPSPDTMRRAWRWALYLESQSESPPSAVIPNGDLGISFSWRDGPISRNIKILPPGSGDTEGFAEETVMRGGKLGYTRKLNPAMYANA